MATQITATLPALDFPKEVDYPTQEDWAAFSAAAELNFEILGGSWSTQMQLWKNQANAMSSEVNNSADIAQSIANYQGDWISQGYTLGQTVSVSGIYYICKLTHATGQNPTDVSSLYWNLALGNWNLKVDTNMSGYTSKNTPIDADLIPLSDSASSFGIKKLTWANLKATLKTYFDTLYNFYNPTPTIASGTATFTSTTNNITLTGIGIGVEIGDVIQISGAIDAKNNSEFTVEVITDNDNIIVNQAHADKRTTKNVATRSGDTGVTVKLLAKWYNASIGLGRAWIAFTPAQKTLNTVQFNNTGREMPISVLSNPSAYGYAQTSNDGVSWVNSNCPTIANNINTPFYVIVPRGYQYRLFNCTMIDTNANTNLTELR